MKICHNLTDFKLVLLFIPPFCHFFIKKERGMNHSARAPFNGCWHLLDIGMHQCNDAQCRYYYNRRQHDRRLKI